MLWINGLIARTTQVRWRRILRPDTYNSEGGAMIAHLNWVIPGFIGVTFTLVGALKLFGLQRGIVCGADKPLFEKLSGT